MRNNINLTSREKEVYEFVVNGARDKEIAQNLYISVNTVRTHVERIFMKLDVNNRRDLIIKVLREK